jgi:hypothetical protein
MPTKKAKPAPNDAQQADDEATVRPAKVFTVVRRAGRPPKYEPRYAEMARQLCQKGFTDSEIAKFFGVARWTIYRWKHEHTEFCDALKLGKEVADDRVERTLYEKAVGYEILTTKVFCHQGEVIVATDVPEVIPPDTGAGIFFLKNRRRNEWRDKPEPPDNAGDEGQEQSALDTALDAILAIRRMKAEKDAT